MSRSAFDVRDHIDLGHIFKQKSNLLNRSGLDKYLVNHPMITRVYDSIEKKFLEFYVLIPGADSIPWLAGKNIYLITVVYCILHSAIFCILSRLEYSHKIFTKCFGKMAYPAYAALFGTMWLFKCYLIMQTIMQDAGTYTPPRPQMACLMGLIISVIGIMLYLQSVVYTGIKKMIGGEVFDHSLAKHPRGGLNNYIDTPHYTASAFLLLGYSLINFSTKGIHLSLIICVLYCIVARVEEHLSQKILRGSHKSKHVSDNSQRDKKEEHESQSSKKHKKRNKNTN